MSLSTDLISQFVKATKDQNESPKTTTVYGKVVKKDSVTYVQLDGSEGRLTPISPTTTDIEDGDRVSVAIRNHVAIITGNLTSPSARTDTVKVIDGKVEDNTKKINDFEIIIADKISVDELKAEIARIESLEADSATIKGKLEASEADIESLKTDKLDAATANIDFAKVKDLEATNAEVHSFKSTYGEFTVLTAEKFDAITANFESMSTKYANIDFSNIGKATMEYFYAQSGLIKDVTVGDQTITGHLVGVTISGDLIEGNTIKAEKLVIKGSDGLYYQLNTDGMVTEAEQTDQNSLNGSIIKAKSITASKISVKDLVAFGATIGGFHITENSLYSGVKESVSNTTRGIYLDNDGQIAFGDTTNFLKFYKDTDGKYKLSISADELIFSSSGTDVGTAIADAQAVAEAAKNEVENIQVGGRNLALNSKREVSNNEYLTISYFPSTPLVEGEQYTMTLCLTPASGAHYVPYMSGGYQAFTEFRPTGTDKQILSVTFTAKYYPGRTPEDNIAHSHIGIYRMPNNGTVTDNTTIHWAKIEKGTVATDWTPAPEDVDSAIGEAQSTADDATTLATNAQADADAAQTTANTASSKADTAQSTVDGVKTDLANNYTKKTLPDTRSDNQTPEWYIANYPRQIVTEFKITTIIGLTGEQFCTLTTTVPWANSSGGYPKQVAKVGNKEYWRIGTSATAWGSWNDPAATATNYMKFENNTGLIVGDMTASTLGRNVLIDADSIDIRNGTSVMASYRDNMILLGMNSPLSVIDLCSGTGQITSSALSSGTDWWKLNINAQNSIGLNASEITMDSHVDYWAGGYADTIFRLNAATQWGDNTLNTIDPYYHGMCYISTRSYDPDNGWGDNHQYIDMNGPNGIVLSQESTPLDADANSQRAAIIIRSASELMAYDDPTITLDASLIRITDDMGFGANNACIYGTKPDGSSVAILTLQNTSGNTVLGWDNYSNNNGDTNIYGKDVHIGSSAGGNVSFRPYYRAGDTISNITFRGAGYLTASSKELYFVVPLAKPIIGSPIISVTSVSGFKLRQNSKYTHGSSDSAYVTPSKYGVTLDPAGNYIRIAATFTTVTNAVTNSAIGIDWNGKITFS